MPFKESCRVEERISMMREYDTGAFAVSDLCRRYGISRETFYVWKRRRDRGEECWWQELSRAPEYCPHATPAEQRAAIVAMRRRFRHFGPKKIRAMLMRERANEIWPSASTIGGILKREGLIEDGPRRRRAQLQADVIAGSDVANGEWAIDFKGWFRTRDRQRCDPLTISDTATRYLIAVRIAPATCAGVRRVLEQVFRHYGLPEAIRSDNGTPFGGDGAGGLSQLSVWLLKLGIEPRHIPPSSPQDNGRHERMHRTLKAETSTPPATTLAQQQARFDRFRRHYNRVRPHEALGQTSPAEHWQHSDRTLPKTIEEPWYDADHQVFRLDSKGHIRWQNERLFIGGALGGELIGVAEIEDGIHVARFCHRELGIIDRTGRFHRFAAPRARLRCTLEPTGT